jgi:hypothetical protein
MRKLVLDVLGTDVEHLVENLEAPPLPAVGRDLQVEPLAASFSL